MSGATRPIRARWWSPAWRGKEEWRDSHLGVALDVLRVGRKKWEGRFYVIVPHKSWLWYKTGDPTQRPFFLVAE